MTAADKRERRKVKHALQKAVRQNLTLAFRMNTSVNQQRQAAKITADQLLAGRNPAEAVAI